MKNWKAVGLGFIAGAACMVTTTALAGGVNVSAFVSGDITFRIDDKNVAAPSNLPVLNYNNSVYVPIRFVGDQLGCDVDYDIVTKQVIITSPPPKVVEKQVEVEKIVYVNEEDSPDYRVFSKLPIRKIEDNFRVEVTGLIRRPEENLTKVNILVENTGTKAIQVVPASAKLEVDGKTYEFDVRPSNWDKKWYNDITDDDEIEGYIPFALIPKNWQKATLTLEVRENGGASNSSTTLEFNIRSNNSATASADEDD